MIKIVHIVSYLIVTLIAVGAALCGWALVESRRPGQSGEVLMVIPGTSFMMFLAGLVLACCVYTAWSNMKPWERIILSILTITGLGLFPVLFTLDLLHKS